MNDQSGQLLPYSSLLAHGVIAVFGAIVHAAKAYRLGKSKSWLDFVTLTVMSSFSGVIFALIALHTFHDQEYITLAIAGTGCFLGVEGMTFIVDKVRTILVAKS